MNQNATNGNSGIHGFSVLFPGIFMDCHGFSWVFLGFHGDMKGSDMESPADFQPPPVGQVAVQAPSHCGDSAWACALAALAMSISKA